MTPGYKCADACAPQWQCMLGNLYNYTLYVYVMLTHKMSVLVVFSGVLPITLPSRANSVDFDVVVTMCVVFYVTNSALCDGWRNGQSDFNSHYPTESDNLHRDHCRVVLKL